MSSEDIATFLVSYASLTLGVSLFALVRRFTVARLLTVVVAVAVLAGALLLAIRVIPQVNLVEHLIVAWRSRNLRLVMATLLGVGAALPWLASLSRGPRTTAELDLEPARGGRASEVLAEWWRQGLLAASAAAVLVLAGAYAWNELYRDTRIARAVAPGYTIEEVATLPYLPIRLAVSDEGRIFVSADRADNGFDLGMIYEIDLDPATGQGTARRVAVSPLLFRPYGLAARDGAIYVSRSGHFARAVNGVIEHAATGAVTQLRDIDASGNFTTMHDVLSGLPGSQGPDPQHQNNGLAFGPDGSLYATQGNPGNRLPAEGPWHGTVLRLPPGATEPEVFAEGLRNPYSMAFGPDDALFLIDNDTDANPGDELNHIIEGEHYGHPFVIPDGTPHEGFRDPVDLGPKEGHLCGLAYADPALPVGRLAGRMLVSDAFTNSVYWLELERSGDTYAVAERGVAARVPTPVDVAVAPDGNIYVLSRFSSKLYRLRPVDATPGAETSS